MLLIPPNWLKREVSSGSLMSKLMFPTYTLLRMEKYCVSSGLALEVEAVEEAVVVTEDLIFS